MNFDQLTKSYINGEWVSGKGSSYTLTNPYNDAVLATFPIATKAQLEEAYEVANAAYKEWAANTALRIDVLKKTIQYFKDNEEEIVKVLAV